MLNFFMPRWTKNTPKDRLLAKTKINSETGCWEWTAAKHRTGYGAIRINGIQSGAHRASYELFCGPIPDELHVCHRCDNKACVNPEHLFLGTAADNMADKVAKGRQLRLRGTESGRAKLTDSDVIAIRAADGITQRKLAAQYFVSQKLICDIRSGKLWKHI
jgi:hypothetical protein